MRKYFFRKTWKYFFKEMRTYFFKEIWKYFLKNIYGYKILIEYFPPSLPLLKVAQGKLDHNWPWPRSRSCPRPCLDTFIFRFSLGKYWKRISNEYWESISKLLPEWIFISSVTIHFSDQKFFFYELRTLLN